MSKMHLRSYDYGHTACSTWIPDAKRDDSITDDPSEVTCRRCEKRIEADLETVDEAVARLAPARARQLGRGVAVRELQDRHLDEFDELIAEHTAAHMPQAEAEIRADIEKRRRWAEQDAARRKADLEAELAKLQRAMSQL